jgi:hypothetical protein
MEFKLQRRRIDAHSDQKLFDEMERIWTLLGHRPSRTEWEASKPTVSYIAYRRRFGGWVNACVKFIEMKMGISISDPEQPTVSGDAIEIKEKEKRTIPLKLRLKVLDRDGYTCVLCGKSPALIKGISLHIDHRIAFSKGGKTVLENLQTLCSDCNLGKGNTELN